MSSQSIHTKNKPKRIVRIVKRRKGCYGELQKYLQQNGTCTSLPNKEDHFQLSYIWCNIRNQMLLMTDKGAVRRWCLLDSNDNGKVGTTMSGDAHDDRSTFGDTEGER